MNTTSTRGNGNGVRLSTETIESNPYLQHLPDEDRNEKDTKGNDEVGADDEGYPIDPEDEKRKLTYRRRRVFFVAAVLVVTAAIVAVLIFYYRTATRVEYGKTTKQREVLPPPPSVNSTTGRDARTERAIEPPFSIHSFLENWTSGNQRPEWKQEQNNREQNVFNRTRVAVGSDE